MMLRCPYKDGALELTLNPLYNLETGPNKIGYNDNVYIFDGYSKKII